MKFFIAVSANPFTHHPGIYQCAFSQDGAIVSESVLDFVRENVKNIGNDEIQRLIQEKRDLIRREENEIQRLIARRVLMS